MESDPAEERRLKKPKFAHSKKDLEYPDDSDFDHTAGTEEVTEESAPDYIPIHRITITQFSYRTYRAVLRYLITGQIDFAQIRSGRAPYSQKRSQIAASPKSLHRLSHLLDLKALKKVALTSYRSQLATPNVLQELFGEVSRDFLEVREKGLHKAIIVWGDLKKSKEVKEAMEKVGGNPWMEEIFARLATEG